MTNEIKFMYNGIKINGQLVKGFFSKGSFTNSAIACFYADRLSQELRANFNVINESDIMTDYFEDDKVYFFQGDKNLPAIDEAIRQKDLRIARQTVKRYEKIKETRPQYFEYYCKDAYERALNTINKAA